MHLIVSDRTRFAAWLLISSRPSSGPLAQLLTGTVGLRLLFVMLVLLLFPAISSASDIYVAQNSAGADNGADCADAHSISFAQNSGNWGSGTSQIGPGKTLH